MHDVKQVCIGRGSAGTASSLRVGKAQQDPELRNALHLLSRNVGALLAHTAGPTLHKLPPDLSVFAKLESKYSRHHRRFAVWPYRDLLSLLAWTINFASCAERNVMLNAVLVANLRLTVAVPGAFTNFSWGMHAQPAAEALLCALQDCVHPC